MNREEIIALWDVMNPRERDAWVAEVVMGWRRVVRPGGGGGYIGWEDITGRMLALEQGGMNSDSRDFFRPSTDISAAWAVFEYMRSEGYSVAFSDVCKRSGGAINGEASVGDYHCNFHKNRVYNRGHAKTAPEAICLAAIIAKLTE